MKKDFILPDIGEGIVECEVIEWKVNEGDVIVEDQIIVDVSTDKAIVESPSMYNGRVTKLYYAEGDIAKVHQPLFALEVEGVDDRERAGGKKTETTEALDDVPTDGPTTVALDTAVTSAAQALSFSKVLTTPAVRKMAREHDLDLSSINGSGKQGRVLKEDILGFLAGDSGFINASGSTGESAYSGASGPLIQTTHEDRIEPIRGVRKIMAERMSASVSTIPHFTYVDEMDVTELMAIRQTLKDTYASDSLKITLMPLFIKALSLSIKQFPIINSQPNPDFTELKYVASHNIGMAVDGKTGLLVPNIKNVQDLTLLDIAREVTRLTEAARSGKINPQELSGGTITISNIGAIGGTAATPITNKPEVAIVALGKIQTLPRIDEQGNVVSRKIMTVSWSGDHRIIDGGTIARFNNLWMGYLKSPATMLATMI